MDAKASLSSRGKKLLTIAGVGIVCVAAEVFAMLLFSSQAWAWLFIIPGITGILVLYLRATRVEFAVGAVVVMAMVVAMVLVGAMLDRNGVREVEFNSANSDSTVTRLHSS